MNIAKKIGISLLLGVITSACGSSANVSSEKIVSGQMFQQKDLLYRSSVLVEIWNNDTKEQYSCTGVMLTPTWVLTAAHCKGTHYKATAFLGSIHNPGEERRSVQHFFPSDQIFTVETASATGKLQIMNDLMLLKMTEPFKTDEWHRTAWIAPLEQFLPKQPMWAVGAGEHDGILNIDNTLMWAEVPQSILIPAFSMIQSVHDETNKGDSGGGLFRMNAGGTPELVGILSGGFLGKSNWTYVPAYRNWINETIATK